MYYVEVRRNDVWVREPRAQFNSCEAGEKYIEKLKKFWTPDEDGNTPLKDEVSAFRIVKPIIDVVFYEGY